MKPKTRLIIGFLLVLLGMGMIFSSYLCVMLDQNPTLSTLGRCGTLSFLAIIPICSGYGNIMKALKKMRNYNTNHEKMKVIKKRYIKTFPYFCDNCKKFSHSLYEYCESCGSKNTLRKAKKEDYQMIFQKQLTTK